MDTAPDLESSKIALGRLRRIVGVSFGIAIVVGGTVGAGILRAPGTVAAGLGRADLIIGAWILVGCISALGANCYAELATAMPTAGGPFVFVRRAFGGFAGFAAGWSDWLVQLCALGYISVGLGEYAGELSSQLQGLEKPIALASLALITALNWLGLRIGASVQQWMSAAKCLVLLGIVMACLVSSTEPGVHKFDPAPTHPVPAAIIAAMILAIRTITETYSGWNGVVYFSEDQKEPSTSISRSLFWGVLAVTMIYVAVNIALLKVLPISTLSGSKLAVADAAQVVFGGFSNRAIAVFSIVSLLGILNVVVMAGPRILLGLARDGFMVSNASRLNRAGAPGFAMTINLVAGATLILIGSFDTLFGMAGFLSIAVDAAVYVSLFRLRQVEPNLPRPFRAVGYPWMPTIPLTMAVVLLVGLIYEDFKASIYTVALLALCFPLYALARQHQKKSSATFASESE
jgi:APA family basic amino acid/polyamine antiporter